MKETKVKKYLLDVIKDIQINQKNYGCYPYPKTIRSILTASKKSMIAPHFSDKDYYGIFKEKVSLTWLIRLLDELVEDGFLYTEEHKNKKRYLRIKDVEEFVFKDEELTLEELKEIDDLLDMFD